MVDPCLVSFLKVNAATFKVLTVCFKFLPETFPQCVDAFSVGNGQPLRPYHNLFRLNRLFNLLQWLVSLCNNTGPTTKPRNLIRSLMPTFQVTPRGCFVKKKKKLIESLDKTHWQDFFFPSGILVSFVILCLFQHWITFQVYMSKVFTILLCYDSMLVYWLEVVSLVWSSL